MYIGRVLLVSNSEGMPNINDLYQIGGLESIMFLSLEIIFCLIPPKSGSTITYKLF